MYLFLKRVSFANSQHGPLSFIRNFYVPSGTYSTSWYKIHGGLHGSREREANQLRASLGFFFYFTLGSLSTSW
jgi:hypothetical protein